MSAFDDFQRHCAASPPGAFVVLGSGMGSLVERFDAIAEVAFADVPGLPAASVVGHHGRFVLVRVDGRSTMIAQGRLHYYEGHSWDVVARPVQIAASLGAKVVILTNAAGGIRADLDPGTLMPLDAHLEWNRPNPWREPLRPSPYSKRLIERIASLGHAVAPGTYASVTGPSYETPAEIRAMMAAGADAVGMSTSREAIAAVAAGMEVAAISLVTNKAAGLSSATLDHAEVMAVGRQAAARLGALIEGLLSRL